MGRIMSEPTDPPLPPGFVLDDEMSAPLPQQARDEAAALEHLRTCYLATAHVVSSLLSAASNGKPRPDIARKMWNDLTSELEELARNPPAGLTKELEIMEMFRDDTLELCRTDSSDPWALDGEPQIINRRLFRFCAQQFDLHANLMRYIAGDEYLDDEEPGEYARAQWYEIQKAIEDLWEFDDLSERERRRLTAAHQKDAAIWRKLIGKNQLVTI